VIGAVKVFAVERIAGILMPGSMQSTRPTPVRWIMVDIQIWCEFEILCEFSPTEPGSAGSLPASDPAFGYSSPYEVWRMPAFPG
jgi:hypothetical protein